MKCQSGIKNGKCVEGFYLVCHTSEKAHTKNYRAEAKTIYWDRQGELSTVCSKGHNQDHSGRGTISCGKVQTGTQTQVKI